MLNDAIRLALPPGILAQAPERESEPRVSFTNQLIVCEIHDVIAYGNSYIVKGAGTSRMLATVLMDTSGLPIGARDATMLTPGAKVLCYMSDDYYPTIMGVLPSPVGSPLVGAPDSITAAAKVGLYGDPAHENIITSDQNCFINFADGRPVDNVPGDWGKFNELGMGVFLGKFMSFMRASDICKLETFYLDNLLRLFAYNYQHYTACSETEAFNDEGEWTNISSSTPYPWEALGFPSQFATDFDKGNTSPLDGKFGIEPKEDNQLGLWRIRTFEGFLGEGRRTIVCVPDISATSVNVYGNMPYKGVLEEHIGLDGAYTLRSAKSIMFEKTIFIPIPTEIAPRDNPEGDTDFDNAAGIGETLVEFPNPTIANLDDKIAYDQQKYNTEGLDLRTKDWEFNEDVMIGGLVVEQDPLTPYSDFESVKPTVAEEDIDHRKKEKYYKGRSFFGFTDDGGFLIETADGSTLRMVNGNIELSCPGDTVVRAGRTVQTWSGRDVIIKAHKSIDVSSATEDVRIKADRNLMALGGNSGTGGVLVENRAVEGSYFPGMDSSGQDDANNPNIGGLLLKSARGKFSVIGDTLHLRSTGGDLVLDGSDGDQDIVLFGKEYKRYLKQKSLEVISASSADIEDGSSEDSSVIEHTRSQYALTVGPTLFSTPTFSLLNQSADGNSSAFLMKGSISLDGAAISTGGFTGDGPSNAGAFSELKNELRQLQNTSFTELGVDAETYLRDPASIGAISEYVGVSFRASDKLSLGTMKIYEAPWQRRFRKTAEISAGGKYGGSVFVESIVHQRVDNDGNDTGSETMPFPGKLAWTSGEESMFVQYDPKFYNMDSTGGTPKPKSDGYDVGTLEDAVEGPFEAQYPIND